MSVRRLAWMAGIMLLVSLPTPCAETQLSYFEDITELTTACFPQGTKLESSPIDGFEWPKASESSLFGTIALGNGEHPILIDTASEEVRLYVDVDRRGELQQVAWERVLADGSLLASVPFEIQYEDEQTASYHAFLIWGQFMPTVMTYCRSAYRSGEIVLGGDVYRVVLVDEDSDGHYDDLAEGTLFIDADRDGQLLLTGDSHEIFSLAEPFNLEGTVYAVESVSQDGAWMQVLKTDADVEPRFPLLEGFPAPPIQGVDSEGGTFSLQALEGNVVVLDFWASWCAPCISELPTLEHISDEFSADMVLVVGINVDRSESDFRAALEEHGISYVQIYDSDVGPIGDRYRVSGIPMTYIIDRTGLIVARSLRGDNLIAALQDLIDSEE